MRRSPRIAADPCNKKYALGGPFVRPVPHERAAAFESAGPPCPKLRLRRLSSDDRPQKVADINARARCLRYLMQAGYFPVVDEYVKATDPVQTAAS
jgi:hypothetical protein